MRKQRFRAVAAIATAAAVLVTMFGGSPVRGGSDAQDTLRVGVSDLPPGRGNPFDSSGSPEVYTSAALFDSLTKVDTEGVAQPMLATAWENTSPTTWEFQLREGVTFSNGEEFTADAVVATIDFLTTDEVGSTLVVARDIATVESATAVDPLTVEITTAAPDPVLPNRLAGMYIPAPAHFAEVGLDGFAADPIGSGPYAVESWSDNMVTLTAVDDSWRAPNIPTVEIIALPEPAARLQALLSDQVDLAVQLSPDQLPQLEGAGYVASVSSAPQVMSLAFYTESPEESPLASPEVRLALNHAVNKDAIVDNLLPEQAAPASQGATPAAFGYDPELEPIAYDPELAQQLLADAGYPDGFSFAADIVVGSFPADAEIYQLMQQDLAAVGVDVELTQITFPEWLEKYLANGWTGQAFGLSWNTAPLLDSIRPIEIFSCKKEPAFFCDDAMMPLIDEANTEFDPAAREAILHEIWAAMQANPPALYLVEQVDIAGLADNLQGFENVNRRFPYDEMSFSG
jgi:peptide/nickel transport system substrate-binding protein